MTIQRKTYNTLKAIRSPGQSVISLLTLLLGSSSSAGNAFNTTRQMLTTQRDKEQDDSNFFLDPYPAHSTKKFLRAGGAFLKTKTKMEEEVPENPFQAYAHKTLAGTVAGGVSGSIIALLRGQSPLVLGRSMAVNCFLLAGAYFGTQELLIKYVTRENNLGTNLMSGVIGGGVVGGFAGGPRGIFLGSCGMSVAGGIGYGAYLGWKAAMRSEKLKMRAELGIATEDELEELNEDSGWSFPEWLPIRKRDPVEQENSEK